MKKILLPAFALLGLAACQNDDAPQTANNEPVVVAFEDVKISSFSQMPVNTANADNFIINSEAEYEAFYDHYRESYTPSGLDYNQYTVVSSVSDFRTGYGENDAFGITSVIQQNDTIHVTVHSFYDTESAQLAMSYQPFHIIKIQKTDLPFKFNYE